MAKIPVMKKVKQMGTLSALWQYRTELSAMFRDILAGRYKPSFVTLLALIGAALYILSPIDLIPDIFVLVGWVDDGFVFYFLLKRMIYELDRYRRSQTIPLKTDRQLR